MTWRPLKARWSSTFTWIAIGWIVVFWRLGYASLLDPDEAHYAELTREMLHSGNWLVPLLDGKPFIDKPVLFHWLQGASVLLLGETEFAARLPSALSAVGLFAITRWAGTALFDAEVGSLGAIMFATIPATFALASIAIFDMVFALFLFGAVASLLVAAKRSSVRTELLGYGLLTLAVMTKGPVALVLVALFLAAGLLVSRETRLQLRWLHWKTGLPAVAIAASPWFLWMQWRFGDEFVKGYLLAGNLWYVTQPLEFSSRADQPHVLYPRVRRCVLPLEQRRCRPWHRCVATGSATRTARELVSGSCGCGRSWCWASSASRGSSWITTSSRRRPPVVCWPRMAGAKPLATRTGDCGEHDTASC